MPDSNPALPALMRDEDLYRAVIRVLDEGIVVQGRGGAVRACNRTAERIVGYTESQLRAMTSVEACWDPVRSDGTPCPPREYPPIAALKTGQSVRDAVVGLRRGDGGRVWIRVNCVPLFRDGGETPYAVVSSFTDVTEGRRADEALKESETRYRHLVDNLKEVVFQTDAAGLWTYLNPAWTEVTGFPLAESLGKLFLDFVHPGDRERNTALFLPLVERKKEYCRHVVRYLTKEGGFRWVEVWARLSIGPDGSIAGTSGTLTDVTERLNAEEEVDRLAHVTSSISDFVVITGMDGKVTWVNQPVLDRFRWSREELEGQYALVFLAPSNPPGLAAEMFLATRAGGWEGDVRNVTRDGHEFWVSLTTSLMEKEGVPVGMVSISRDITERKLSEEELRRARDSAETASRSKSEFLANMSHEIRTPMNAVIGMTGLLLETELDEEQRDFVETIRSSGDSLLTILNDILDFSKMESGMLALEQQPFDVRDCVEEALDLMAPKAAEKGIDLAFVVEDSVPPALVGDVTRVRQVVVNLVSNAIKFTPAGEVSISVTARPLGGGRHEAEFAVRDTGIGISDAVKGRLFQSFSQVDASTTRQYGGTGLGLAISKRLTELMGGRIWLESEPGRGSIFRFTLVGDEAAGVVRPPVATGLLAGLRALVVDDNPTNRRILSGQLRKWGIETADDESPVAALERLSGRERFDLALLDRQMPGMDGLELAGRIRELPGRRGLPLVLLSSVGRRKGDPENLPFAAILTKPVKPTQLLNVLRGLSEGTPLPARRNELEPALDAGLAGTHPLRILLAEDNAVNQKVALRLIGRLGYRADVAANGVEALAAIRRQPYDLVFLDVQMPEMDGLEAARRILKEFPFETQRPRLVAMTANAMKGDREACLAAGMDDYVAKPVKGVELMQALRATPRRDLGNSGSIHASVAGAVDGSVLANLRLLSGEGEPDFVAELIDLFVGETPVKLDLLATSARSGEGETLKRTAHSLKSSSASLGARRLSALCAWLEGNPTEKGTDETLPKIRREFERVKEALRRERGQT